MSHSKKLLGAAIATWLALALGGCSSSLFDQGVRAMQVGDLNQANDHFDAAIAAGVRAAEAQRERAAVRLDLGDVQGALADLEATTALGENDARRQWLLGRTYNALSRFAESATAYRSYERLSTQRSVRRQTQIKIAQLERRVSEEGAALLAQARRSGVEAPPRSVAVYSFAPLAGREGPLQDQKICRALEIWVSTDLAKVAGVQCVAAQELELLYAEQQFTYDNRQYFDPESLLPVGNLQPARHMVRGLFGTTTPAEVAMGAACYDSAQLTSDTCSEQSGDAEDLFDLETELVLDILGKIDVSPTQEELLAIGKKPTRNMQAFLAFADGAYLQGLGRFDEAADAFQQAYGIDPGFAMAKEAAAQATAETLGATASVVVPGPPATVSGASSQAMRSSMQLGLGLIPDAGTGDSQTGVTTDIITARGDVRLDIRGETRGN